MENNRKQGCVHMHTHTTLYTHKDTYMQVWLDRKGEAYHHTSCKTK